MYVAWLVMYTKSLIFPAALGFIVQCYGMVLQFSGDIESLTDSPVCVQLTNVSQISFVVAQPR